MLLRRLSDHVPDEEDDVGDDLGQECEAFLAGRYVEWATAESLPVPSWARLNRAAHADLETIRAHVDDFDPATRPTTWLEVELLVEYAVLTAAGDDLEHLQQDVLVPLELELVASVLSPRATVDRVCRAVF